MSYLQFDAVWERNCFNCPTVVGKGSNHTIRRRLSKPSLQNKAFIDMRPRLMVMVFFIPELTLQKTATKLELPAGSALQMDGPKPRSYTTRFFPNS